MSHAFDHTGNTYNKWINCDTSTYQILRLIVSSLDRCQIMTDASLTNIQNEDIGQKPSGHMRNWYHISLYLSQFLGSRIRFNLRMRLRICENLRFLSKKETVFWSAFAQIPSYLTMCFSGRSSMLTKNVIISSLILKPTDKIKFLRLLMIAIIKHCLENRWKRHHKSFGIKHY